MCYYIHSSFSFYSCCDLFMEREEVPYYNNRKLQTGYLAWNLKRGCDCNSFAEGVSNVAAATSDYNYNYVIAISY